MIRFLFCLFALLLASQPGSAALPAEAMKPYRLQVVLHVAEHPILTGVFQERVQRELHDSLQAALGGLARVEVVRDHPRLQEVETKGLKHALDGWNFINDTKIQFVFIDFVDGRYEIQARQYDGSAGLPSPVVRRASTTERLLVARNAGLIIDKDFGLVGTITHKDDKKVEVTFKGGGLGTSLERWVKKDDIFAVAEIVDQAGAGQVAFRVPWTLLQVSAEPKDGKVACLLHHRWGNPLPDAAGVLGYRCLKLGTIKAPLRLRVVSDDKLGTPLNGKRVQISGVSFQDEPLDKLNTNSDGLASSAHPYKNVAFVIILEGGMVLAKIPIAIVDERIIPIPVNTNVKVEARGQIVLRKDRWLGRVFDAIAVASSVVNDVNGKVGESREAAMKKAQDGLRGLEAETKNLKAEHDALVKEAGQAQMTLDLTQGEQYLRELQDQANNLQTYITKLSAIVNEEKDPKRQKWKEMAQQAKLLEAAADYDQAITLYEKVFEAGYEDAELKRYVDKLKSVWPLKNDKHLKAETFIYQTWPKVEFASQMKAALPEAREAFETCKGLGDWMRLRKLYKVNVAHAARLGKEVESLRTDKEDDRKTLDIIDAVSKELLVLDQELEKYLREAESKLK
jgi:hypothetical protein